VEQRTLYRHLWDDLAAEKSMIFLSGPRQTGKTTFVKEIVSKNYFPVTYFNWDNIDNKKTLLKDPYFFQSVDTEPSRKPLVIFDEIHKYRSWKNYLKGVYDQFARRFMFAVLGSGRLEMSKRSGDAMTGRFWEMHLFPFTLAELSSARMDFKHFFKNPFAGCELIRPAPADAVWRELFRLGGFPEPFLSGKETTWQRWSANYGRQIIRDDMRTINEIRLIDEIETLFSLLPTRVGSPLSINNLATDLQVSFPAINNWLDLFDHFYLTFRISPWSKKISRAILREKKLYLFNYPSVADPGARFENMVALELLRAVRSWNDWGWGDFDLRYVRNKEKKEVDFLLTNRQSPFLLIETKLTDPAPSPSLAEFQSVLKIPAVQLVHTPATIHRIISGKHGDIGVFSAARWLAALP
jgi:uncharacterized protein